MQSIEISFGVRPAQIRFVDNKIKGYAFEED